MMHEMLFLIGHIWRFKASVLEPGHGHDARRLLDLSLPHFEFILIAPTFVGGH